MTILRPRHVAAAAIVLASAVLAASQGMQIPGSWTRPIEPFHIAGNIYYVGTEDLASYLVTSPAGHVLIETGLQQNGPLVAASIGKLGFKLQDVKVLLTTQAHVDHVGAHAELQRLTGASVVASEQDALLLEGGGKGDYHFGAAYHFPPVRVDRRVKDGEQVLIGDTALAAMLTPGHTQGTTTWSMPVRTDTGETLIAVWVGSTAVNEGVKLVDNRVYPQIATDFKHSFERLQQTKVDIFLTAHLGANGGLKKAAQLRAGAKPNPFIDPGGFTAYLAASRKAFESELAAQSVK
jgi:metallo-beta-lactamase class B